jgi:hypothetical protein
MRRIGQQIDMAGSSQVESGDFATGMASSVFPHFQPVLVFGLKHLPWNARGERAIVCGFQRAIYALQTTICALQLFRRRCRLLTRQVGLLTLPRTCWRS